ncbi:MAG: pyridoxamine 5'-phosphate oxidase family protein [Kiritimatiellae bacterium]|nr:pyridoxamine 5'-phosphate oxidase family protein [Kiritimatiellia bacterium]
MSTFREMRRIKQKLGDDEALEVLGSAKRGVLSVIGDDGWPYGVWINPYVEDGRIYFHGAKAGHKIDALRKDARASFAVVSEGVKDEGGWAYTYKSVVVFGRVEFVEDQDRALEICRRLARRFNPSEADIADEIRRAAAYVQVFSLVPEHITGKRVHEA